MCCICLIWDFRLSKQLKIILVKSLAYTTESHVWNDI